MRILASIVAATSLAAATSAYAQDELRPPANWQQLVDQHLEMYLKDPYSAVKRAVRGPRFGNLRPYVIGKRPGWLVCYSVNAKNGYGAYTGAETYVFQVTEAGVIDQIHGEVYSKAITEECALPPWRQDKVTTDPQHPEIPL